ncbi:UDP-N-acetylmuramoyl-tripeptide--D-alanyl-D-alanine ligase [Phaeodactylibacter luteus]|uniref:UDP-N-acetylmuramoyl-tripeptide--D-alanyl-D-alanine ligase n=1 Tax=Phaeodactylibacter luteus TaxID=1564516 RepID=A0A5C6RGT4_9BACT|nr:UDP-N-acetylmuramoyl-tripeptide--D-alanyl-D-alanine ligase [Phaeodactylibacter luteus]TXB61511.1 UDP-N-acetylmuramoyl-tripeptide--D-alanyl-D-alanine ligase [Phaeodactylibacter luteus]
MVTLAELYQAFQECGGLTTDSRRVKPGQLFWALKGEHFDGNAFAHAALKAGARYAVASASAGLPPHPQLLEVEDTLQALQDLGRHHRRQFTGPVVGITGSNGKTTTKELVAAVMQAAYRVHFTQGNLNNHIGVPLTLLAMPADTEIAIIEMGANHQGEIDALSRIAEPTHGLITNIGKAHLEGFGGIEGVKKGKSELYRFLAETGGTVFINQDEPFLSGLAEPCKRKVFYGSAAELEPESPSLQVVLEEEHPFLRVAFKDLKTGAPEVAQSQLIGRYNLGNIATAVALGQYFKVPAQKISRAIAGYRPANMRTQLLSYKGLTCLLDAYNANPTSMLHAIRAFQQVDAGQRIAVLGEMLELGADEAAEHDAVAQAAVAAGFTEVWLVGKAFRAAAQQYGLQHFEDVHALKAWFRPERHTGSHILVKGSRGNRLELLLDMGKA